MSENLDLVRSIYARWERGDFSSRDWADPEIDIVIADGPAPGSWHGYAEMAGGWREFFGAWEDWRVYVQEYRELDGGRVLALEERSARAKRSGLRIGKMAGETPSRGASVFHIHTGKVTRFITYFKRDRALADLGLEA
jgi:SnoaL-like domain